MRQIDILVPVWGEKYCRYLTEVFLPSLMKPNNLPLLNARDGHRLLLATTFADSERLMASGIVKAITAHITPSFVHFNPEVYGEAFALYATVIAAQERAQHLLLRAAKRAGSLASLMSPDLIFAEGMIAMIIEAAEAGKHVLLVPSIRQSEERVNAKLKANPRCSVAELCCQVHAECNDFEVTHGVCADFLPFRFWRFPEGVLLHTFHAAMAMADMRVVGDGHLVRNIEGYYYGKNFAVEHAEVCTKPMIVSLTSDATNWSPPQPPRRKGWWREIRSLRRSMDLACAGMPLKRHVFKQHMRWNHRPSSKAWLEKEQEISRKIAIAEMPWVKWAMAVEDWLALPRRVLADPRWAYSRLRARLA